MAEIKRVYLPEQAREVAGRVQTLLENQDHTPLYAQVPWGPYTSLRHTSSQPFFESITGSPLVKKEGRMRPTRGKEYYLGLDPFLITTKQRLQALSCLYQRAQEDLSGLVRKEVTPESFSRYAAAFDARKQASLYLYHALSYPERAGISLNKQETAFRDEAFALAYRDVRMFYQFLMGAPFDPDAEKGGEQDAFLDLLGREQMASIKPNFFKMQELDHPLVIAGCAIKTVKAYPDRDTVIAMPAGGTQLGIVTQLAYQQLQGVTPDLHFVPYSTHSAKTTYGNGLSDDMLQDRLRDISPKAKVVVVDDNTNSGTTLDGIRKGLERNSVYNIRFAVAELDPRRIIVKSRGVPPDTIMEVANIAPDGPLFNTAIGVVPITEHFRPDRQLRQLLPLRKLAETYQPHLGIEAPQLKLPEYYSVKRERSYDLFDEVFSLAQRRVGSTYGYRNAYMVAMYCYQELQDRGLLHAADDPHAFLNDFVGARLTLPFLPQEICAKLDASESSEKFEKESGSPWVQKGAGDLVLASLTHVKEYGGSTAIWTKGDSGRLGYGKLIGVREQQARFKNSGLRRIVEDIEKEVDGKVGFIADPDKVKAFADIRYTLEPNTWVIAVDDLTRNLDELGEVCDETRINYLPIKIGDIPDPRSRMLQVSTPQEAGQLIRQLPQKALILMDMDGTLLHEDFIREHLPINSYLATRKYLKR